MTSAHAHSRKARPLPRSRCNIERELLRSRILSESTEESLRAREILRDLGVKDDRIQAILEFGIRAAIECVKKINQRSLDRPTYLLRTELAKNLRILSNSSSRFKSPSFTKVKLKISKIYLGRLTSLSQFFEILSECLRCCRSSCGDEPLRIQRCIVAILNLVDQDAIDPQTYAALVDPVSPSETNERCRRHIEIFGILASRVKHLCDDVPSQFISDLIVEYVSRIAKCWHAHELPVSRARRDDNFDYRSHFHGFCNELLSTYMRQRREAETYDYRPRSHKPLSGSKISLEGRWDVGAAKVAKIKRPFVSEHHVRCAILLTRPSV
jgi:hypothetical protein